MALRHQCGDCSKPLAPQCKGGFCERCRKAHVCSICQGEKPKGRGYCDKCKTLLQQLSALEGHGDQGHVRLPKGEREARIAVYAERAAKGEPLFVGVDGPVKPWRVPQLRFIQPDYNAESKDLEDQLSMDASFGPREQF